MAKKITKDELSLRGVRRGMDEQGVEVDSPIILLFGDTHFSAKYQGSHKDYYSNCVDVMVRILEIVRSQERPVTVIFLGDIFGVKERNISPQTEFLTLVIQFFKQVNEIAGGRVYSVRGNHDYGEYPDFFLFEQLDLIKNPDYVDFKPNDSFEGRFHILNYGNEHKDLPMAGEGASNIILGHNDFAIEGVTNWYGHDKSIDLRKMTNFIGADMVISGHIHDPSPELYSCTIGMDAEISLFYPGCPTRVSQRYDDCFYVRFEYDENDGGTDWTVKKFGLKPAAEIFHPRDAEVSQGEVDEVEDLRTQRLEDILEEISSKSIFNGDVSEQIKNVPHASEQAKTIALEYLEKSF